MPFSGYIVSTGERNLGLVGAAHSVRAWCYGCVLAGMYGGVFRENIMPLCLVSRHDPYMADPMVCHYGESIFCLVSCRRSDLHRFSLESRG